MNTDPKLTTLTAQIAERSIAADAKHRARLAHYPSQYEVLCSRSVGKPGCFDVVLIKKAGCGGSQVKGSREIIRAWRGCASWNGRPGSPMDLALKEAHALRREIDPHIQQLRRR